MDDLNDEELKEIIAQGFVKDDEDQQREQRELENAYRRQDDQSSTGTSLIYITRPKPSSLLGDASNNSAESSLTEMKPDVKKRADSNDIGITYVWKDINVFSGSDKGTKLGFMKSKKTSKHILKNVLGIARPGELMALMGSSGAGKSTLLNTLTHRNLGNLRVTGERLINGVTTDAKQLKIISAYVQQDDLFISTLTVGEYLNFYALLRLPGHVTRKERKKMVYDVLKDFSLLKCARTTIGSPTTGKGCSGGEIKRLSFACEFLTDPPLMFCDEPTSGLDSFMAATVIQSLKNMASKGKTIICTIHQPPSDVFGMFDKILLMAEGRVAFCGDRRDAIVYFESLSYKCPKSYNPADFFINTLAISHTDEAYTRQRTTEICDNYEKTSYYQDIKASANIKQANQADTLNARLMKVFQKNKAYKAGWCRQFGALLWRAALTIIRDPTVLFGRVIQTFGLSLVLGLMFFDQKLDSGGITNLRGALFLGVMALTVVNMLSIINVFCAELPIFRREHRNGVYRCDTYFFSRILAELPLQLLLPFIFTSVFYWMVGFNSEIDRYLISCGIHFLLAFTATAFSILMSTLGGSINLAMVLTPLFIFPLLLFSGLFLNIDSIPSYLKWIKYLSFYYYGHESLAINQWDGIKYLNCGNASIMTCPWSGDVILKFLHFDKDRFELDIILLVVLLFGYLISAFLVLLLKSYRKS